MQRFIKLKTKRMILGGVFAVLAFVLCLTVTGGVKQGIFFGVLFLGEGMISPEKELFRPTIGRLACGVWLLFMFLYIPFLSQLALNEMLLALDGLRIVLAGMICFFITMMFNVVVARVSLSISTTAVCIMLLTTANYFVFQFRGAELSPMDFSSINTAAKVAGQYRFVWSNPLLYAWLLLILALFFQGILPWKTVRIRFERIVSIATSVIAAAVISGLSGFVSVAQWRNNGTYLNGYLLNFVLQIKMVSIDAPEDYSTQTIQQLELLYGEADAEVRDDPHIIVIMDESFVDIGVLGGELHTNVPITPFVDSLQDNTVRGYALSSVFAGGTANSEYEFLTGNSMIFNPSGGIVYQQYLREDAYSFARELSERNYYCVAMHPYYGDSYNRPAAYNNLGFDIMYDQESFDSPELVREFISDREMFEKITSIYEEIDSEEESPLFLFGVSMQNHGGYAYSGDNFKKTIELEGYSREYDDVEQYLSLIHETDDAVEYLIDYFQNVDDKVVVTFFGDHFPSLDREFYQEVHGGTFETLADQMLQHKVPFFIWANYDIDERYIELTGLNYLASYVYEVAGIELPAYNQFLCDMQEIIPAVCALGYYSIEAGTYLSYEEATGDELLALRHYHQLYYNSLHDSENRSKVFFPSGKE